MRTEPVRSPAASGTSGCWHVAVMRTAQAIRGMIRLKSRIDGKVKIAVYDAENLPPRGVAALSRTGEGKEGWESLWQWLNESVGSLHEEYVKAQSLIGNRQSGKGKGTPKGRKKDPLTKQRADFAESHRDLPTWPAITAAYRKAFPDDKKATPNLIRQAHARQYPAK